MNCLKSSENVKPELKNDFNKHLITKLEKYTENLVLKCGEVFLINGHEFELNCFICEKQFKKIKKFCLHILKEHKNIQIENPIDAHDDILTYEINLSNFLDDKDDDDDDDDDDQDCKTINYNEEQPTGNELKNEKETSLSSDDEDPLEEQEKCTKILNKRQKIQTDDEKWFECSYCELKFKRKFYLRKHLEKKHTKEIQENENSNENSSDINCEHYDGDCNEQNDKELNSKKIICKVCGKETSKNKLTQHLRSHDDSRYTHKCNECGKLFISEKSLDIHTRNLHLKDKPFVCEVDKCNRTFVTEHALTAHQKLHSSERPFQCPQCFKEFLRKSKLNYHIKINHINRQIFKCDECEKEFFDMYTVEKHKIFCHSDEIATKSDSSTGIIDFQNITNKEIQQFSSLSCSESNFEQSIYSTIDESIKDDRLRKKTGTYECNFCALKFIYKSNLKEHINRKHSEQKNQIKNEHDSSESEDVETNLKNCKKKSRIKSLTTPTTTECKRKNVTQSVRSQEKLICDICGKETIKYKMLQHLRSHDNSRYTHKCETCGKLFISEKSLNIHMKNYHLKDRPFACTFIHCNKRFATEHALTAHNILHTSERPFKCSICQKGFVRKSKMEYHIKTYHVNGRIYKCDECGKRFYEMHTLQVHKICHSNEKPYECDECPARFPRERSLAWHKQSHSGVKPYICKVCGKEYALYNGIYSHMKTHGIKYSLAFERGEIEVQNLIDNELLTSSTTATATKITDGNQNNM